MNKSWQTSYEDMRKFHIDEIKAIKAMGTMYKCKHCKKKFFISTGYANEWAYRIGDSNNGDTERFCSYHCIQDYRRIHKPKRNIRH